MKSKNRYKTKVNLIEVIKALFKSLGMPHFFKWTVDKERNGIQSKETSPKQNSFLFSQSVTYISKKSDKICVSLTWEEISSKAFMCNSEHVGTE